jgi:hypothetical protein
MVWHVWHHDAVQKVINVRLSAALSRVSVWRSLGWRTGSNRRFWCERVEEEGKRENARWVGLVKGRRREIEGRSMTVSLGVNYQK